MSRSFRWSVVLVVVAAVCGAGAVAFSRSPIGAAVMKSRSHFIQCGSDSRVWYEPGMEAQAERTATGLAGALRLVESQQFLPIARPFRVYVCNSQDSFNTYMAAPSGSTARGVKVGNSVFLSPECFDSWRGDTHAEVLAHELSHLQLYQRIGHVRYLWGVPVWFAEGLAVTVSGGGGEAVTAEAATAAVAEGHHFIPDGRGSYFRPKRAADYGMETYMFYRQSELFVTYIRDRDPAAFKYLLLALQEEKWTSFPELFEESIGIDIAGVWTEFLDEATSVSPGAEAAHRVIGTTTEARRAA